MELEDISWPGELEEEEEAAENLDEYDVVMVEEMEEEEGREPDADFNYESQRRESTDDEEDEEAKAWLQAHPGRTLPQPSLPRHSCSEGELTSPGKVVPLTCHVWQQPLYQNNSGTQISDTNMVSLEKTAQWCSGDDQRTESWHYLPQEMDSSHTLDTTQTRFNVREKGTEVTDFPSLEEGILTQSNNQVKESNSDLLCSPLLVIQDNFASPDLPLLTCLTKDQEFGPDSLFHQSELDFAPVRGIPGKSEDTEWFSRPSEVSEALFQAASEVASNLVNNCFSVSQHPLIGSTAIDSQRSLLTLEQGTKEEIVSRDTLEDLKTPKDSDSYDALYSYMSWKTQEVIQEPETNLADKDQVSFSTASDTSDEYITPKGSDSFDASCSYVQYGKQEALQQLEKYLTSKDRDSYSDSSDTIDKNKIHKESDNFSASFSDMPWSKQGASHHPEICLISKDCVSFPHEVAPRFYSKMPHFLHCLLERGGREVPLTADSHYFESVYLRAPAENEMKQKMDSLEGYKGIEEDLGKELSQCFELKENRNTLVFSEVHPRSSEIQYIENVVVTDNSVEVSEAHILSTGHDTSKMEVFGGPLQTIKSNSDETSEQLCFQEERNQKPPSAFGGKNVDATENVAFQAVIASIEPSEKESTVNEIQTDINKSLTNDSQENEPKNPDLSLLNYDENFFFDKLNHPRYQSTPGVFESAASKPLLYKKDDGDSSLYWHPNIKSLPSAPQEIFIKPLSLSPELKSSSSLSEKSLRQAVGLGKTQSALFQYDTDSEPFLPIGKIKSVSALDLAEKLGSSNIIYPMKVWTSDSLVLQDLKQHTFEEVADSSNCILGKNGNSSNVIEDPSAAVGSSFSANLVACNAKSQGALPVISDASLIAVGQETLLKADIDQGEIPRPVGAKSSFTVYTITQNDSYFVEGLQGKAESDICTLDDTECCSLDENDVCRKRVVELQREICDQGDLTGECIKLAGLGNLLDDLEICDSSLHWQSTVQLPSKEESSFEEPVCLSNMDINQSFASVLPPSVPHEPTRELEYHSSDLRMLRVSPDTVPGTFKHSTGDTSKGDIAEIPQSTLKPGITATPEDSDTVSHLSLSPEDFSQLAGSWPQVKNIGQHTDTLNQQTLADSRLTEEALKVSAVPGLADQKTEIATVPSSSYSQRGKPNIFYPQGLPDGYLTEETLKVAAVPGLGDQKTSISTVPPSFYSLGEKHSIFYPQALPDGHQTEEGLNISFLLGLADLKTGKPTVPASSYSVGEEPGIFYQQALPGSHLPEEALKVSPSPRPVDEKTGLPTASSTSYSHGEKPRIFYQQTLPESHLTEQALKVSAASGSPEQKTGIPIVTSTSYSHREKPSIFYQQELPDSHVIQEVQQVSAALGLAERKTGIPTISSTSYSHREEPLIFYQQELPDSCLTEQAEQVSAVPGLAEQKTGISTVPSTSYSHREKPSILYQQELPVSHLIQQVQQVSAAPGLAEQKTGISTGISTSYSHREKPSILYQQELPDSHLTEQAQKVSPAPGTPEQKTGIPIVTSTSYSHREKPSIFYQQDLPDSHLTKKAQKVPALPGLAHQKSGTPIAPPAFYSHRGKTSVICQQELPDSHLSDQTQKISAIPGLVDQNTGIQTVPSSSCSQREKPITFYWQELPDSLLTEEAVKVSAFPRTADQNTGIPTGSSRSYSFGEKPGDFFYQQVLPDGNLSEEALKVSPASRPSDQKTGILSVPASSYSHREKPSIFYPQALPGSHLSEEALKDSAISGLADQKTGTSEPSGSYSHREKSSVFYQQELPDSHLTGEAQKVSGVTGTGDQKTGIPIVTSASYLHKEKPTIFYQQALPDRYLTEEALNVSTAPRPTDQKTGIPAVPSSSYSYKEKPIISYQQELPDLTQVALKVLEVPGPADQKIGIPAIISTSSSYREKPIISYQQELPDPNEDALKRLELPGQADQTPGMRIVPPTSYSHRESPIFSYQKELPDTTEETLKVFALPGPADQNAEIPTGPSSSYSHKEKLRILPDDQKAELLSAPLSSYSHREKPKTSTVIGPDDQKTPLLTGFPNSYSQRVKPSIFFQQQLPDRHQSGDILKISPVPEPTDVNSWIQIPLSSSSSHREKSNIFYPKELPDKHLTEDSLKVSTVPGPADQKTVLPAVPPSSFSHREKSVLFYQQDLPERHLTESNLKFSSSLGQAGQITGLSTVPPSTYSHSEKHKLVSDHVQRLIDNLDSSNASVISNNMPLNSQADGRVVINKPESSGFEDVGSKEIQDTENSSKTLKEIQTLLMEAENIALRRCNFPVPLVPFRDVSDISFIQSKKVVCFKEPPTTDASNGDLSQRQPFTEESPNNKCIQKDISTQTNLKCQRGIENWEFISSTTVRSPLQEAESKARVALDETLRQYKAARSVMRSDPEGYSRTIENKIVIPMMTVIKSDSSSDASSCSWDSNSLESVSDVLLNFFPYSSPKTSMTDSKEEEGVLESDDGGGSSVDSLAAHVKNLLKCESSLNHAKQILRNAEEEESRVQARAWNLKFNMAHECGYSISEINEDDRRKVEELKAKLCGHGRTTDLPKKSPEEYWSDILNLDLADVFLMIRLELQVLAKNTAEAKSPKETKTPFSPFSGKLSSDAVTQITTESPRKAMFSSEIFVNAEDRGHDIPELSTRKLGKVPVKFASSSLVQQITVPHGTDGQPLLLPYKPSGSTKMYYVPQLRQIPSSLDSKSDTTIESSHSGSNDAIPPDFPAQVLGTRDDDLADTVNVKHKEGIYSKRVVTKASLSMGKKPFQKDNADAQVQVLITGDEDLSDKNQKKEIYSKRAVTEASRSEEKESLQKDIIGSSAAAASEQSAQLQDTKIVSLPDTEATKQKEEIHSKRTVPKEGWPEEKKSSQIDIAESRCHSEFENTTHSVFRSAKFYFHHPVHLPSDQDFCHESLGRRVFVSHSWKDSFQHHPDKQREHTCLPSSYQNVAKTKSDYTTIESLSINVNLENKEVKHTTKSQARDFLKYDKQVSDLKRDHKATPELTAQHTVSLNELWNRYQERQRQQKPPEFSAKKELSLVERLDHLAKLLQHPITHFLQPSESTQDDSKGKQDVKEWSGRQQQQKNKLQKKKRYKSLEKCHKNTGDLKKNKVLSTHQAGRSNQIKIEQIKFDKYILRKQPGFHYINNTSSDSRHSEESELLTDTATSILSTTTSVESDILTQTDKEVTLHERSSSISTIDTARLIHAFGHERVCLSPRRIKLYSSVTDHQRRYLEKRSKKNKKPLNTGYPQLTSEHTRRKHVQVTDHISSDSVSSSTSSFWSSSSTLCNKQNVHMLNKGIQAGTLEIVNGVRKHTRDVGMTFPTPSSSEARVEEDSDVTSWSEEKIEEKRLLTSYLGDRKLRKNKQSCWEGVSWFVPVENVKSGPKKENLPKFHGPGVSWFAPVTNTTPWREPLQEQNWQGQHMDSHSSLAGPGRDPLKPFVRATLQESLQLHRPDFISRSGERIKRLKLIVQERKLQNMLQSEREALFNTVRGWQGHRDATHLLPKRDFLAAQKKRPVGKKEMIQRSKWIYEQLPEVQKKREEEKRRLEYKSYRLRAQLYKKKLTNQLLGRKVPWN
ncbi:Alstrom syndrome protein 1 [Neophocaena asiaeorientalis asiaeorientalis]|uniref:Alstrom syndrome protein 1 n=1 Tax=Neophocaena asiaeorientalis asiaeorientalis TaxID=1706337 RepID=A0A341D143_NEOAA|nr:Alstrom syndrome protein 1 [Neophocaena asiaeorientalis asiaeorientalis]